MLPQDLQRIANDFRLSVLKMVTQAGGGHIAGPLSSADLFAVLFFDNILRFNPEEPWSDSRDRLVLSCGHYVPVLYAALAKAGYFEEAMLETFGRLDGLPVHPERLADESSIPGIEASTGPLGQGMSVAVGIAKALKIKRNLQPKVYCIVSDGELQEGQAWEAIGLSVREKLDNLVWIIDANNIQIEHYITELAGSSSIVGKLEAWGCHTLTVDGNDISQLQKMLEQVKDMRTGIPIAVVCKTVGGKGVTFMENLPKWHDGKLSPEQIKMAEEELNV